MRVLVDIEWVTDLQRCHWPTQLAAFRIDSNWDCTNGFSSLVYPELESVRQWDHPAYSGWRENDFLSAPSISQVFARFIQWLMPDDLLCWWHGDSIKMFNLFSHYAGASPVLNRSFVLKSCMYEIFPDKEVEIGSPYKLCDELGICTPSPMHCAPNDVIAIQRLLKFIALSHPCIQDLYHMEGLTTITCSAKNSFPYLYDIAGGFTHRADCKMLKAGVLYSPYASISSPIKKQLRPCACCENEFYRDRIIRPAAVKSKKLEKLAKEEDKAIGRMQRAKDERESALRNTRLQAGERKKVMTLTQPGYAFWASEGYNTFHLRNCPRLSELSNIRGFSKYKAAIRAGYLPCRQCKPSQKHDAVLSVPINNKVRDGESMSTLLKLCEEHGIPYEIFQSYCCISTSVGKWKVHTHTRPVRLYHINLVKEPNNEKRYHVQPRVFLSLKDTFDYIMQHDENLIQDIGRAHLD